MGDDRLLCQCLYFTANSLARTVSERAERHFVGLGMSPSHAFLLAVVIEKQQINLKSLVAEVQLAHSTVSRHVDFHVARGYVEKEQQGKTVVVTVTAAGRAMSKAISDCWLAFYEDYSAVLGKETGDELAAATLAAYDKLTGR